ncbi:MAG: HAMP domain-containing histidine kinase [bacterium]|nr:HAMP domain-containing histidine kinase [bacterium]
MKFTGATAVLLMWAAAAVAIAIPGEKPLPTWVLVACGTALPAIAAVHAAKKGERLGGREGLAWRIFAVGMVVMTPIYLAEFVGATEIEDILIAVSYALGGIAIITVPLPNAGPYQRLVASLDAAGLGLVVATGTFWVISGSELDTGGHAVWVMSDTAIMVMLGYVAVRRSQDRGVDWAFFWLIGGVGAYLGGVMISSISTTAYFIGHPADFAYFFGMGSFALATTASENRARQTRLILKPVRWVHVLAPYTMVVALTGVLIVHEAGEWGEDIAGSVLELGILTTILLVLVRQLAMIVEQRHKIELEQNGVIATVSHELRTPLTTVMGFLDLLEDWDKFSDEEKIEMVSMMRSQSHVMGRVVGDLVAVAREEIEQLDITRSSLSVDDLLRSAIELVPELQQTTLSVDVAPDIVLTADQDRMLQIITNYLSNATKYGSGHIDVVAFDEHDHTVIEVHDDGPGIPDIFRLVIWERFERGPQRQGSIPGSGIGLSVARGIARSHGGETQYRSSERLGGGCFSVHIPIHHQLLQQPERFEPAVPA